MCSTVLYWRSVGIGLIGIYSVYLTMDVAITTETLNENCVHKSL